MEEKVCEVHKTARKPMKIPIRYGLFDIDAEFNQARQILFPYAFTFVSGGCEIQDDEEPTEFVCEECRKDEAEWRALTK